MPATVLVGTQWGDEGKGKIIDVLTKDTDVVVRYQGGNNAGHTVEIGDKKYVLHLIPSGIFREGQPCVIGNGLVVDPIALVEEMEGLVTQGLSVEAIQLSTKAHLILPYHKEMDAYNEMIKSDEDKIGTTKRGIGPSYADKASRTGIRALEMLKPAQFEQRFRTEGAKFNKLFADAGIETLDLDAEWLRLKAAAEYLTPYIMDTVLTVNKALKEGKNVLFEGAQGTFLDIDHGTYPFVTSSNTTSGGACTGAGVSPKHIDSVWGVMKVYTTRVGEGPFPTELDCEVGEKLAVIGGEVGATTGRSRRCGWFDAVASNYSCMINGVDKLALTKVDVLDTFDELLICTAYDVNGVVTSEMPTDSEDLAIVKPIYETMPGWNSKTSDIVDYNDLPIEAKNYINRLAELVESEIGIVSVGPNRAQTFEVNC